MFIGIPILLTLLLSAAPAPDTLVVCPTEFQPALAEWKAYRQAQGHQIVVVAPPSLAADLHGIVRREAAGSELKYLLLVGDVPGAQTAGRSVPTNYRDAKINTRWGSEPTIASDVPYCDLDGDDVPDLAVGRVPADSAAELVLFLRKVIRYEQAPTVTTCERHLDVVAGAGGFGALADAMIEAAGRHVIQQTVPRDFEVAYCPLTRPPAEAGSPRRGYAANQTPPAREDIREKLREQLRTGGLAWIYLGHGLPTSLDLVQTPNGPRPAMTTADVANIKCGGQLPLAVLVACYTGAFDARDDCLAEKLALSETGPVAVVAATRVTMPYGNTVLGYELLRACFADRQPVLGDVMRLAQRRTLEPTGEDPVRKPLDSVAQGISPAPVDLAAERAEHVLMYHLLGDPLLRLRMPTQEIANRSDVRTIAK